jgi:signal transduction histidine kinase
MALGVITLLRDVSRERELDRMKSEFISTAAHELRTPLTVVKGFSEILLNQTGVDETQQEYLEIILNKSELLENIIGDMLDLSRVESGQVIHVEMERCDIISVIERSALDYQRACGSHRFEASFPANPVEVLADRVKITQVMENLLSNAVKFSKNGNLIRVTCVLDEEELRIVVSDEGIGMTSEQVERVFDKFYRVDSSNTAKPGLGLGMSIVKNIVEAHGGRIWVESALGKGTMVTFTLPRG